MSKNITLTIGENRLSGWIKGEIMSSILTLSDSFELQGWNVFGDEVLFQADDECVLEVAGESIITGYIDEIEIATNGGLRIKGRDKTRDLVDCQAITTSFLNQTVLQIINGMAADFGISASGDSGPTVSQFIVAQDETAAHAILRLVTDYGMIVTSDKEGNVVVRNPGEYDNPGLVIKEGDNIKSAKLIANGAARFSEVKAFGQNFLSPGFSFTASGASTLNRPKRVFIADEINQSDCELAANRMRDYSNGSSVSVECVITTLDYIPAGTALSFQSEVLRVDGEMVVENVLLSFNKDESSVTFNLVSPEKYGGESLECGFLK